MSSYKESLEAQVTSFFQTTGSNDSKLKQVSFQNFMANLDLQDSKENAKIVQMEREERRVDGRRLQKGVRWPLRIE